MSDQLLDIFKICLLALLYLFFARVLWAVWSEVRPQRIRMTDQRSGLADPTLNAPLPAPAPSRAKPPKGRGGRVGRLTVIEPRARRGTSFAVGAELTIGRASGCTISITDDGFISQLHARVYTDDSGVHVEDLGSTNGTYLNGQKMARSALLNRGDRVQIGTTVLEAQ